MKTLHSPTIVGSRIIVLLAVLVAVGCKSESADQLKEEGYMERNPIGVPPEAKLVRHSAGHSGSPLSPDSWFAPDNITFRPASPGGIWVVDEQNATVAFHGRMKSGDRLVVAPKSERHPPEQGDGLPPPPAERSRVFDLLREGPRRAGYDDSSCHGSRVSDTFP